MIDQELLLKEIERARCHVPKGFTLVTSGTVNVEDRVWNFIDSRFDMVTPAKPFVKGQKRPGLAQHTQVGQPVSNFVSVVRKV